RRREFSQRVGKLFESRVVGRGEATGFSGPFLMSESRGRPLVQRLERCDRRVVQRQRYAKGFQQRSGNARDLVERATRGPNEHQLQCCTQSRALELLSNVGDVLLTQAKRFINIHLRKRLGQLDRTHEPQVETRHRVPLVDAEWRRRRQSWQRR
ncbi:hypothetical protein KXX11_004441, partial [Aspergillus fumigatus]